MTVPTAPLDIEKFRRSASLVDRYPRQLQRLRAEGNATGCIEHAVTAAAANLADVREGSLVVYGEPQSGKTEMMICLTAKLLDDGHPVVVHLLNDSVDLLSQNLRRFRTSGLAPAAKVLTEIPAHPEPLPRELVVFCKKNARDLQRLIDRLAEGEAGRFVVVDDEADFATPNSKINAGNVTRINELVGRLIGADGYYIGVTATPARLDLNNTFQNRTEKWVNFPTHDKYTGQDVFFPLDAQAVRYRRRFLSLGGSPQEARQALVRFLVTSAYMNTFVLPEQNFTMLVHTSGKKADHQSDRDTIATAVAALSQPDSADFDVIVGEVFASAEELYPDHSPDEITDYVVRNASRAALIVLNSERDRKSAGDNPTIPTSPFTIIIGGNIVSRGVTFPNLLSMFFTRDVRSRLQQDTYIQRARMFGARGAYLDHFELTIPRALYVDWHRCFVFHKLALQTITKSDLGSPVWIGDPRIAVAAASSINRATVVLDKGEMSFQMFDFEASLDAIIQVDGLTSQTSPATLRSLRDRIGDAALPGFLIDYIEAIRPTAGSLAIHTSSTIQGYRSADIDKDAIQRRRGFIGKSQLEGSRFPDAVHHVKILHNLAGKARVFYKYTGNVYFMQNLRG